MVFLCSGFRSHLSCASSQFVIICVSLLFFANEADDPYVDRACACRLELYQNQLRFCTIKNGLSTHHRVSPTNYCSKMAPTLHFVLFSYMTVASSLCGATNIPEK